LQNVVTYTVVISGDNPLGRLLPGMTANVEIITGERAGVVVVPNDALRFQPRGPAEALVRDTTATGATQVASGTGHRTGRLLDRLKVDLELTPEEVDKVRAGVGAEFTTLKSAAPPGTEPSQDDAREQARMRIAKVLRVVLTPDQYKNTRSYSAHVLAPLARARCGPTMVAVSCLIRFASTYPTQMPPR
jgi:HlyD family secretion protein